MAKLAYKRNVIRRLKMVHNAITYAPYRTLKYSPSTTEVRI